MKFYWMTGFGTGVKSLIEFFVVGLLIFMFDSPLYSLSMISFVTPFIITFFYLRTFEVWTSDFLRDAIFVNWSAMFVVIFYLISIPKNSFSFSVIPARFDIFNKLFIFESVFNLRCLLCKVVYCFWYWIYCYFKIWSISSILILLSKLAYNLFLDLNWIFYGVL